MKAVFYVLALLVSGGAAFFSYQNHGKFKEQQDEKLAVTEQNRIKTKEADDKDSELQQELADLETATKDKADAEASVDTLKSKETALRGDLRKVEAELEEQKSKFAELELVKKQVDEILKGTNVTLESLPDEVIKIEQDKKAKTDELAELESNVEAAERVVASNRAEVGRLTDRDATRNARIRRNAMESVVSAVNDDWGFVVIGAGSNTGFTPQTKLLVKRDGRLIAEVQPSAIEPSQTIAEIDPESVAPGARIQPGDRVILSNPATN